MTRATAIRLPDLWLKEGLARIAVGHAIWDARFSRDRLWGNLTKGPVSRRMNGQAPVNQDELHRFAALVGQAIQEPRALERVDYDKLASSAGNPALAQALSGTFVEAALALVDLVAEPQRASIEQQMRAWVRGRLAILDRHATPDAVFSLGKRTLEERPVERPVRWDDQQQPSEFRQGDGIIIRLPASLRAGRVAYLFEISDDENLWRLSWSDHASWFGTRARLTGTLTSAPGRYAVYLVETKLSVGLDEALADQPFAWSQKSHCDYGKFILFLNLAFDRFEPRGAKRHEGVVERVFATRYQVV